MAVISDQQSAGASASAAAASQAAYENSLKTGATQDQASSAAADAGSSTYNAAVSMMTPQTATWDFNSLMKNPVFVVSAGILVVGILRLFKKHKD